MSARETSRRPRPPLPNLEGRAAIPRDTEGPVFAAPWEAKAFALAVGLCEQGRYSWREFQHHLIEQIGADEKAARAERVAPPGYYHSFLAAALKLYAQKELLAPAEIEAKIAAIRAAFP